MIRITTDNKQAHISDDELILIKRSLTREINVLAMQAQSRSSTPDIRIRAHYDMTTAIRVSVELDKLS